MPIHVNSIAMRFGERLLFSGLSTTIREGERLALLGPSGAGKSTFLSILARTTKPSCGQIVYESQRSPTVDWLFQSTPLLLRRSARDNVALGGLSRGLSLAEAYAEADSVLATLGLEAVAHSPAFRMSGGERQRLAVARSVARHADVVLADEPTASLDAATRAAVCDALRRAAEAGAIVVIATHDPWVAAQCDRALVLET